MEHKMNYGEISNLSSFYDNDAWKINTKILKCMKECKNVRNNKRKNTP